MTWGLDYYFSCGTYAVPVGYVENLGTQVPGTYTDASGPFFLNLIGRPPLLA